MSSPRSALSLRFRKLAALAGCAATGVFLNVHRAEGATILAVSFAGTRICAVDQNAFACDFGSQVPDDNPAAGVLGIGSAGTPTILSGYTITGTIAMQTSGAIDTLSYSSLEIHNDTGQAVSAIITISATDFAGPVDTAMAAGSGTWVDAVGSSITLSWYNDPANNQGATSPSDRPGVLVSLFANVASTSPASFSYASGPLPVADPALYSMTLGLDFTLVNGGRLLNLASSETKLLQAAAPAPEPGSMVLLGTGVIGWVAARRSMRR